MHSGVCAVCSVCAPSIIAVLLITKTATYFTALLISAFFFGAACLTYCVTECHAVLADGVDLAVSANVRVACVVWFDSLGHIYPL
jgi:hypothetical protein